MIPESIRLEMAAKLMAIATGHDWENMNRGPRQRFYRMARIAFEVAGGNFEAADQLAADVKEASDEHTAN
jgi:hypothetical protein